MKIYLFTLCFFFAASQVFAVDEVLLKCEGTKTKSGFTTVYTILRSSSGKWKTKFTLSGVIDADAPLQPVKVTGQEAKDDSCVISIDQTTKDKDGTDVIVPMKLVYADKDLTLQGDKKSNFANAPCSSISKSMRAMLNNCKIEEKTEVNQGVLCRSDQIDGSRIDIRIDTSKDLNYSERTIYQYQGLGKKTDPTVTNYGTRATDITANLADEGKTCVVEIHEVNPTKDKNMKLVMKLPKPFGSNAAPGTVYESHLVANDDTKTLPDKYKNMQCEFMGDFYEKVKGCDIDTTAAGNDAPAAKKSSKGADQSSQKQSGAK